MMSFSFLFPMLEELEYSWPFAQVETVVRVVAERDLDHHYHSGEEKGEPREPLCSQ